MRKNRSQGRNHGEGTGRDVKRIVLLEGNFEDWRAAQLEDQMISMLLLAKETGERPSWQKVTAQKISAKNSWSQWDALRVEKGVLHKK